MNKKLILLKSSSPFLDIYEYSLDYEKEKQTISDFVDNKRKTVVVQGLGFVGTAMAAALSNAVDDGNEPIYNVIGVDLPDEKNYWKIARVNEAKPPVVSNDNNLVAAYQKAGEQGNLLATYSEYAYDVADIVVIDIHLDIKKKELGSVDDYEFSYKDYLESVSLIAERIREDVLVVVETTVPPGTTENIILPLFKKTFSKRGLNTEKICLSHSYERVMPGKNYYDSIVNYYRVYSAIDKKSKEKTREFLSSFINTKEFPLKELHSTTASETAKVLENSYRAMNIAFIKEWAEFAQNASVDLYEIIDAIRVRPTHKNIMLPGFGVGGYCLTKDALLADWSSAVLFEGNHLQMSIGAIATNDVMPKLTYDTIINQYGSIKNKKLLIMGVSYLNDVADTRYSPTEYFYNLCESESVSVSVHDPIVSYWDEKNIEINTDMSSLSKSDIKIVVFTVRHKEYLDLESDQLIHMFPKLELVVDANNVVSDSKALDLIEKGIKVIGIGKGHWKELF